MTAPNITDVSEENILRVLFKDHVFSFQNMPYLGLRPGSPTRFSVREPFIPAFGSEPGDIDLLGLLDAARGTVVAAEAKRLKVRAKDFLTVRVNKLRELDKGAEQVNSLFSFGFSRTMLIVMTEIDSSDLTGVNEIFRVPI